MLDTLATIATNAMRSLGAPVELPGDALAIMGLALRGADERARTMQRAWAAYYGDFPDALIVRKGEPNDNIKVNRVRPIVNTAVYALFGAPPAWELPELVDPTTHRRVAPDAADAGALAAEANLKEILRVNKWDGKLLDLGTNGAVCGTAFVRFLEPTQAGGWPAVRLLDPACTHVCTAPDDIDEERGYVWTRPPYVDPTTKKARTDRVSFLQDDAGRWIIQEETSSDDGKRWVPVGAPVVWPYAWCPVLHCKNLPNPNQVYGQPLVTDDLIQLNKQRNFNLSNRNRIDRFHGHPKVWARGMRGQRIDFAVDAVIDVPSETGVLDQLVPAVDSTAAAGLGRELDDAMLEMTGTPAVAIGRPDAVAEASGVALSIRAWPLGQKTAAMRTQYGPLLVETYRRLLEMAGHGDRRLVELKWRNALPSDPKADAETVAVDLAGGYMSRQTAAERRGLDWDTERQNLAEEAAPGALAAPEGGPGGAVE